MNIWSFETRSLVKNGLSPAKVAEDFSVYRSTVYRWMKRAEKEEFYGCDLGIAQNIDSFLNRVLKKRLVF